MTYNKFNPGLAKWWERLLLRFKPNHYCEDTPLMTLEYKWLFGRMYILRVLSHPPQHCNCRCYLEAQNG